MNSLHFNPFHDSINIDDMQKQLDEMKRTNELRQRAKYLHEQHYKITVSSNASKVMTWIPDSSKKDKRKKLVRTTMEALLDELVLIYIKEDDNCNKVSKDNNYFGDAGDTSHEKIHSDIENKTITFLEFYPQWLKYQELDHDGATIARYEVDWKKYFIKENLSRQIIEMPMRDIKSIQVKEWAYKMIEKYKFTSREYYNISTILRQGLAFAASEDIGIIDVSPFKVVIKKSDKKFKHTKKAENKTQVFNLVSLKKLIDLCWEDYNKNKRYLTPLAILFMIETGVRIGELLGLFWSDVCADVINIERQYGRVYENSILVGYDLKNYTKSDAGERTIPLTSEAINILQEVKKFYIRKGIITDRIFSDVGYSATRSKLYRYCDKMNEIKKGNHKIRKTFVSRLLYNGVSINDVRVIAGHSSEQTTLRNYTFGIETDDELKAHVREALAL